MRCVSLQCDWDWSISFHFPLSFSFFFFSTPRNRRAELLLKMLYIGCRLRGVFIRSVGGNAFPFFFGALSKLVYVIILILFLVLNTDVISIFSLSLSRNNRYGNCCSDYNAVCKGSGPPVPPPPSPPPSPPGRLPATCQEVVYGNPAVRKLENSKYAVSPVPFLNNGVA